eukprot:CAMPEP_0182426338 /NCGR_PEP_ID=MMETSP1167-20130531/12819_1 /TAXON_ID=2988 /ORGANISM="Mallomonas Sp, Strain CCMP3275" /LENGTH=614 /DNA_ID=CAMNT_0024607687 /DNA_START=103 /DNA_END=1947 /DNA_ORIENTATION=+
MLYTALTLAFLSHAYGFLSIPSIARQSSFNTPEFALNVAVDINTEVSEPDLKEETDLKSPAVGYTLLKLPNFNKGASFTREERNKLKIRGLVPAGDPLSLDTKVELAITSLRSKDSPIEKYIYLHTIQDADETLYYAILIKHTAEVMPFVYTPTVGEACQKWSDIYRHTPRGLYLSINDLGRVREVMDNYPLTNIKVICVTDGERILGLGDLGVNGMGIPIGKLALYVACAGINPKEVLPVHIDVGTNTLPLHSDPSYLGLRRERERGEKYDNLIAEFFEVCKEKYGNEVLIQFEDFGNSNAFRLLEEYRSKSCCFNDDIQGTAAVVLSGLLASTSITNMKLSDHKFLFLGAGEAGVGIADLLSSAIVRETGCSEDEARRNIWLVDSQGLLTAGREREREESGEDIAEHKQSYAHESDIDAVDLLSAVKALKPTAIIGVSAQGGAFNQEVIEEMSKNNNQPLIFALSNPTSKAECTAEEAYTHSQGTAVFSSGSPFPPFTLPNGNIRVPGQGNNAYIFPGVGLAAVLTGVSSITDEDFLVAADALAKQVSSTRLSQGSLYPPLDDIREVSGQIAASLSSHILSQNRASPSFKLPSSNTILEYCRKSMYIPSYND